MRTGARRLGLPRFSAVQRCAAAAAPPACTGARAIHSARQIQPAGRDARLAARDDSSSKVHTFLPTACSRSFCGRGARARARITCRRRFDTTIPSKIPPPDDRRTRCCLLPACCAVCCSCSRVVQIGVPVWRCVDYQLQFVCDSESSSVCVLYLSHVSLHCRRSTYFCLRMSVQLRSYVICFRVVAGEGRRRSFPTCRFRLSKFPKFPKFPSSTSPSPAFIQSAISRPAFATATRSPGFRTAARRLPRFPVSARLRRRLPPPFPPPP